ncbi:MAG: hydrogenase 4 subunit F [Alphaproteobacteria bacterium]|nr:MAG: hydrogenase 4 subunit F [Alphaproteobacteria bacterium]
MTAIDLALVLPVLAAICLGLIRSPILGGWINAFACFVELLVAILLVMEPPAPTLLFFVDDFNVYLVLLTVFVAFTTALFSAGYVGHEVQAGRISPSLFRLYHAGYQLLLAAMVLALVANNIGLMWVAVEAATLITVVMVSLYRTREAIEASWKYFVLGSVGIALALFGTILVYLAAQPAMGPGMAAMAWTLLHQEAAAFAAPALNLAFVFLLIGYGTKVGLVPLHNWLPDAHAEGPTPISAVLSGLLLNVALYALLRFKMLLAANGAALAPGPLMIGLGLASVWFAGLMLYRRRDIKRFFAYSSIEHMGLAVFAFGLGGAASFAGLLHMAMHSLTKSAIFFAVGRIAQVKGSQSLADIRGVTVSHPLLGWLFVASVLAIAGAPPFGVFVSEFLLITATVQQAPWLAAPLVIGLVIGFGALLRRVHSVGFGEPGPSVTLKVPLSTTVPLVLHLALVLIAGLALPAPFVAWMRSVAGMLG